MTNFDIFTVRSWKQPGLKPFNPLCEGWSSAIGGVGLCAAFKLENEKTEKNIKCHSYDVRIQESFDEEMLSIEEENILKKSCGLENEHSLVVAQHCANDLLVQWRRALSDGDVSQDEMLLPTECVATEVDRIVVKVVEFVKPSSVVDNP
eukprot:13795695-Ditylum_brightwellii.AAC.1